MTFRAPVADILFSLRHVAGVGEAIAAGRLGELDGDTLAAVLGEAGRFAAERVAPLNRTGDQKGAKLENGRVFMPPGFGEVYKAWAEAGWGGVTASPADGGMGLPHVVEVGCAEMWAGACMAFSLCPGLTESAVRSLVAVGSAEQRGTYVKKLVSGQWTGTMNLTEPQAGSDLAAVRTRAEPQADGTYRLRGQKIFITFGEHDMAENIIHLVLARLPDAPEGTKGLSLFLAPKFLVDADGRPGRRNDLRCLSLEHKMGIHASPTCVMAYGENEGATAWLVGEENKGLAAMFIMMNGMRLSTGLQGVGIAERATQKALAFARERRQGRSAEGGAGMARPTDGRSYERPIARPTDGRSYERPIARPMDGRYYERPMAPIIEHVDVQRMLLTMKALTQAARGICHMTAMALDGAHFGEDAAARAQAANRAALLTPLAKAFSSEVGDEVASLGVQVHGGMGFIEETGAAQLMRDARIVSIYEGTNGIQAIDLVTRKLPLEGGAAMAREIAMMRDVAAEVAAGGRIEFGRTAECLRAAVVALEAAAAALKADPRSALAGANAFLRLFSLALGGACLVKAGLAGLAAGDTGRAALARFFAEKLLTAAPGLAQSILSGADALAPYEAALAEAS